MVPTIGANLLMVSPGMHMLMVKDVQPIYWMGWKSGIAAPTSK